MTDVPVAAFHLLVAPHEGYSSVGYVSGGVWTIGYGTTRDATGKPLPRTLKQVTPDQAKRLAKRDLIRAYSLVKDRVKVAITVNQSIALVDFIYNVGETAFLRSKLLSCLNHGDYEGASREFTRWVYSDGKRRAGLVIRRQAEVVLFRQ